MVTQPRRDVIEFAGVVGGVYKVTIIIQSNEDIGDD